MTTAKFFWYLHRLRAMEPAEIAGRVMEKTRKWSTPTALAEIDSFQLSPPCPLAPPRVDKREAAPIALRDAIAVDASRIRDGDWNLFGWKNANVGTPPRWNHDFLHDAPVPCDMESAKLDHRSLNDGADARCCWEINRWSELVRLAQNAWLNEQPDDARLVQQWLADWCEHNPPALGLQWTSALEVSIRLINFCWIDAIIRACEDPELTAQQDILAQRIVPVHAWWAWRHRSFGSSANNHLIGELAGVVIASSRWPSLTRLGCCGERAWQLLEEQILRQFAPDGGNREQALHYHLFAWELAWQAAHAAGDLAVAVLPRLRAAARFFVAVSPSAEGWDYGDSDDAAITPLFASRANAASEWRSWLLSEPGGHSIAFWLKDPPIVPMDTNSAVWTHFPDTGHAVLRKNGWMLRADGSPLGLGKIAAHGHLDALHISIWHQDQPLIIDPGTGAYFSGPEIRSQLADGPAHNGPWPTTGRETPRRLGPFLWSEQHPVPCMDITDDQACVLRFASGNSPFVKRTLRPSGDGIEIVDDISCKTAHQVTWQFPPQSIITTTGKHSFTLRLQNGSEFSIHLASDDPAKMDLLENVVSPRFGQIVTAPALRVTFTNHLKTNIQSV